MLARTPPVGALVVLLLVQAVPVWDLHGHLWTRHFLVGAIGLGIFLILVPVGLVLARREHLSLRKISHEAHEEEELEHQAAGFGLQAPGEIRKQ